MKTAITYIFVFFMGIGNLSASTDPGLIQLEQTIVSALKGSWCSEEKAKLILECVITNRPQVCVEIGPFTGSSTLPMLAALRYTNHKAQAYVIDAWSNEEAVRGLPKDDPNAIWWASLDMRAIKNQFTQTVNRWSLTSYVQVLHMSSERAVSLLPSINFLHLDGNFSAEGSSLDTRLYLPKVVPGGHILISNVLTMIGNQATKMKALWPLFESCELVSEIENGNALLFKKRV